MMAVNSFRICASTSSDDPILHDQPTARAASVESVWSRWSPFCRRRGPDPCISLPRRASEGQLLLAGLSSPDIVPIDFSNPYILFIRVSDDTLGLKFETIHEKLKSVIEDQSESTEVLDGANRV